MTNRQAEDRAKRLTESVAESTLRSVLGTKTLSEILSDRESISHMIQSALDGVTDSWGVTIERVEIIDIKIPEHLQRAMAVEAEAIRQANVKVIRAEGEKQASHHLKEAADVLTSSSAALPLRYLQTLNKSSEQSTMLIFPLPK